MRPDGKPLIYLDNAATTQRPRQVIDAVVDVYASRYANVHRGIHWLSDQTTDLYEESREKIREFINAGAREEVIVTHGTTEGINLVAHSWGQANIKAGDEILLTEMEHHSNIVPWQQLAERTGAVYAGRRLPMTDGCTWRRWIDYLRSAPRWWPWRRCRMYWGRSIRSRKLSDGRMRWAR